ncbi:hypothetical protein N7492_005314 [Penicillium capsulatum]|uniref:Uncharacterized protein n=1 Tax=Penicillium capsulatum TaxID=69766 RepID=A0A9W9LRJ3_9EURO|nr:hypothetical protein N7492_005314 [Penicillium capsulatum]KAJ6135583.1 hypothetical protein N7512_000743 [Penicillium capsulatum]
MEELKVKKSMEKVERSVNSPEIQFDIEFQSNFQAGETSKHVPPIAELAPPPKMPQRTAAY